MRFKSAMGRGGVVEDIEVSHIQMTGIKHEAVILTMSYVLNLLNREQGAEGFSEDDIPYFKNITMHNINCMGAETAVKLSRCRENRKQSVILQSGIHGLKQKRKCH